ncbi:MAG: hypothetical protein GAK45_01265 [Pseudomonas citronellolis]|nr:MAG: hypothetical protein GAK45_01265 [Pseudomonas citronellolis]
MIFWGLMDLFYIGRFLYLNIESGRVPLYSDLLSFLQVQASYGGLMPVFMFGASVLLNLSVLVSCACLLGGWRAGFWITCLQTPLRLYFAMPSLAFLPWLIRYLGWHIGAGMLALMALLVGLEALKLVSLYPWRTQR